MAVKHLGVDIGATHVRVAEVEFSGKGAGADGTLTAFGAAPLPPGAVQAGEVIEVSTVAAALKQLLHQTGCSTKEAILGVGAPNVVVRELDLPAMPMAQLKTSLPFQVQELLPMSPSEAMLDFFPTAEHAGESGSLLRGVMVAAPKSVVAQNVLAVENAGLRPKVVDLGAFSLLRSQLTSETAGKIAAFVDIGARVTTVVVAQHGVPRMVRILPSGGQDMTDAVATALQMGHQDAEQFKMAVGLGQSGSPETQVGSEALVTAARSLVESIRNTFVFYASNNPGAPLEHVVITGGGSLMSGLGQFLASASRVPVSFGNAFGRVTPSKKLKSEAMQGNEVRGAMAVGLAFGEMS
ncbi:type IV pilus assembly protein PilM [Demequina sp. NBRC 110051]|uniref:type IV pilus assembly protein PilM n=1 Tax=Demequina sp. NBRC 110051 TaxID=1570340 RepID=UPI0009FF108D|nr:type IV pilus assembly protein PilM [Demequina sp. NBRC 110051]